MTFSNWKYNRETDTFKQYPPPKQKDHTTLIYGLIILLFMILLALISGCEAPSTTLPPKHPISLRRYCEMLEDPSYDMKTRQRIWQGKIKHYGHTTYQPPNEPPGVPEGPSPTLQHGGSPLSGDPLLELGTHS